MANDNNKNALYRLSLILTLLDSDEYSYSINDLTQLTGIPKSVLYDDIVSIMSDSDLSIVIYAVDEDYDSFEYSSEFVKVLKSGRYDDVELAVNMPNRKDISVVLSNRELIVLDDFLSGKNFSLIKRREGYLIKNNIASVNERDIQTMTKLGSYIDQEKCCKVAYVAKDKTMFTDTIRPLKIVYDAENNFTYLAFYKTELAFYRLDRIKSVEDAPAGSSIEVDMDEIGERLRILWAAEISEPVKVKIKIYDEYGVARRVRRDLGESRARHLTGPFTDEVSINDRVENDKPIDYYIYEDEVIGIYKFAAWVRSYGSSIVVLEPEEMAKKMVESAVKRLSYYE